MQQLRWQGRCAVCLTELDAGELGRFDPAHHEVTCSRCATDEMLIDRPVPPARPTSKRRQREDLERQQVRALIADARAKLDAARHAG